MTGGGDKGRDTRFYSTLFTYSSRQTQRKVKVINFARGALKQKVLAVVFTRWLENDKDGQYIRITGGCPDSVFDRWRSSPAVYGCHRFAQYRG
ncbi:hypothetical protein BaRGS_00018628 [Batillaria attramentaria]|uniref:Uncharacterized protein n=1 Tax=Batillaria attramentaria TaxID=370345 RepID=A0ABD0KS75_9CAEN